MAKAGFSDPHRDASEDDLNIWRPNQQNPPKDLNLEEARFILLQVADHFCNLYSQEHAAYLEYMEKSSNVDTSDEEEDTDDDEKVVVWKRVVEGVREMCDVCETTLFNYHWICKHCGFCVCIDCFKARKKGQTKIWGSGGDRDQFFWFKCNASKAHEPEEMVLAQITAGDSFQLLAQQIHTVRAMWGIPQDCRCPLSTELPPKDIYDICQQLLFNAGLANDGDNGNVSIEKVCVKIEADISQTGPMKIAAENENSALSWLADVAIKHEEQNGQLAQFFKNGATADDDDDNSSVDSEGADLHDFLVKTDCEKAAVERVSTVARTDPFGQVLLQGLDEKSQNVKKHKEENLSVMTTNVGRRNKRYLPNRMMTINTSSELYKNVPHDWLCEGRLLRLLNPLNVDNINIFQEQWKRGQPVIVSKVSNSLNMDLWRPEAFSRDFGEDANDLINCMTGSIVPNQPMKQFWDGFDYVKKRMKDKEGKPMLLKLKDWPPGEDFAEILPTRFTDLMRCLPLADYTKRDGKFNLASRLPGIFVRPDLGPKMYNAYGSALHPTKGTTNLHLDISDAVNVMVYVGIPRDTGDDDSHIKEAFRAIDDAGCDILTRRRVRENNELPGALWHIYAPRDADKIRDLINKVAIEKGERIEPNHDPIHDQSWYLDRELRDRLYTEHNVRGYPIAQCLGDAVFIPAGAPHQVRNLHNCVKVAEDFVSPENVSACFDLTHEFRALSDTHSNHEDKLQIKNIIYHAVKDAISTLTHTLNKYTAATANDVVVKTEMIKEEILKEEPDL